MIPLRAAFLVCLAIVVGACAPQFRILANVENGGDLTPVVTVDDLRRNQLSSLSISETVVAATGTDEVVTRTNGTRLVFIEPHPHTAVVQDQFHLTAAKHIVNDANPKLLHVVEHWNLADKPGPIRKRFVITALNTGKKAFSGAVVVFDRLHPVMSNVAVTRRLKVFDQRATKAALSGIPFVGLMTLGMDDFKIVDANPSFVHRLEGEVHRFDFRTMSLQPGEGVLVEFAADIVLPPIEELRKTAVPFTPGQ